MLHKNVTPADRHAPWNWEFANATERTAFSGAAAGDVNKLAYQASDKTGWILTNHSPVTWAPFGTGGLGEAPQDGKQYARKNAGWEEVVATGSAAGSVDGGSAASVYLSTQIIDGGDANG